MRKSTILFLAGALCGMPLTMMAQAQQKQVTVTVQNAWNKAKTDEPVVVKLSDLKVKFEVRSAQVWDGETEVPSQLDDLNRDGVADELVFVTNVEAQSKKSLKVTLSSEKSDRTYTPRVYAQMKLNDKGQKHPAISYLTVPGTTAPKEVYSGLFHHGPAFESELVAYRIYFDNRQSIDIYGKKFQQLELQKSNYYSSNELKKEGYGNDVLWAGKTVSVGSFRGWENQQPQYVDQVAQRSEGILAYGPVRTVVEVVDRDWNYQGASLNMTQHYILYAGHRDLQVEVSFREAEAKDHTFCTGVMKVEEQNVGFLQGNGLAGSWGVNLPEKTDTINNPRETVGLGVYVPQKFVKESVEDAGNYLLIMHTNGTQSLNYRLTFNAVKEEKGYKSAQEWFAYLHRWQEELQHPCTITIK